MVAASCSGAGEQVVDRPAASSITAQPSSTAGAVASTEPANGERTTGVTHGPDLSGLPFVAYDGLDELEEALVAAGIECDTFEVTDPEHGDAWCGIEGSREDDDRRGMHIAVRSDRERIPPQQAVAESMQGAHWWYCQEDMSGEGSSTWVIGANWSAEVLPPELAADVASALGGIALPVMDCGTMCDLAAPLWTQLDLNLEDAADVSDFIEVAADLPLVCIRGAEDAVLASDLYAVPDGVDVSDLIGRPVSQAELVERMGWWLNVVDLRLGGASFYWSDDGRWRFLGPGRFLVFVRELNENELGPQVVGLELGGDTEAPGGDPDLIGSSFPSPSSLLLPW
jgi:hypothetical protein